MNNKSEQILKKLGIEPNETYMDNKGRIMQKGLIDNYTGIYRDNEGKFFKSGSLQDEYLGIYQNSKGEFFEHGGLLESDIDTKLYQNLKGEFLEKTGHFQNDSKIGIYQDNKGNFISKNKSSNTPQIPKRRQSVTEGNDKTDIGDAFKLTGYLFIFAIVTLIAIIGSLFSPLILLSIYFYKKRENVWWLVGSILTALYLIYDINFGGVVKNISFIRPLFWGTSGKILTCIYSVFAIASSLIHFDQYSSKKLEYNEESENFFLRKDLPQRRNLLIIIGLILSTIVTSFIFIDFKKEQIYDKLITSKGLNIRESDSQTSNKVGSIQENTVVEILEIGQKQNIDGVEDYWYKIKTMDGTIGYIFGAYTNKSSIQNQSIKNGKILLNEESGDGYTPEDLDRMDNEYKNLPFVGTRYFNFYGGNRTGHTITIEADGNTIITSDGTGPNMEIVQFPEYNGIYTNPLKIPIEGQYLYYKIEGNFISSLNEKGEVEKGCMEEGKPCTVELVR